SVVCSCLSTNTYFFVCVSTRFLLCFFFFFFQAEDGIRDWSVTGVQTCALPISPELARMANDALAELCVRHGDRFPAFVAALPVRSEERRVGKEGRSRWAADHLKKKREVERKWIVSVEVC